MAYLFRPTQVANAPFGKVLFLYPVVPGIENAFIHKKTLYLMPCVSYVYELQKKYKSHCNCIFCDFKEF